MRQFAAEQLEAHEDPDTWRRKHAEHFAVISEEIAAGMRGSDELLFRERLMVELDNLRTAVQWTIERDNAADVELGLRIIAALSYEASFNRPLGVGVWAERAAEWAERTTPARRSDVLGAAASSSLARGDLDLARTYALAAISEGPQLESWSPSLPYMTLAYRALATGEHHEVRAIIDEWRAAFDLIEAKDFVLASGMWTWSSFSSLLGDEAAVDYAREGVALARTINNPSALVNSLHALGMALARTSPDEALALLEEAVATNIPFGKLNLIGNAEALIAQLRVRRGDTPGALEALRLSVLHLDEVGDRPQFLGTVDWAVVIFYWLKEDASVAVLAGVAIDGPLAALNNFPGVPQHGDSALSKVEARLGADRYRELVAHGAAMSYDDIVQFLLREIDRLLVSS
jgi:hypothetical protein